MRFLRLLGADFVRSPVSALAAIVCAVASIACAIMGNVGRSIMYAILGTQMLRGRKDDK